jgi:hypothetical protein
VDPSVDHLTHEPRDWEDGVGCDKSMTEQRMADSKVSVYVLMSGESLRGLWRQNAGLGLGMILYMMAGDALPESSAVTGW